MFVLAFVLLALATSSAFAHDSNCAFEPGKTRLSRIVAIDSTKGPSYRPITKVKSEDINHSPLVLNDHEVMLIFKDGPQSPYTTYILDILDKYCVKATFFVSPKMAAGNTKLLQTLERLGHTVAADIGTSIQGFQVLSLDGFKGEIEKSFTSVKTALGKPVAPFFLSTDRPLTPEMTGYLAERNLSVWQADVISGDTAANMTASKLANQTIARVQELGRGIILLHDTRKVTVDALDSILLGLKAEKYKVVHVISTTDFTPNSEIVLPQPSKQREEHRSRLRARDQLLASARRQIRAPERPRESDFNPDGQN